MKCHCCLEFPIIALCEIEDITLNQALGEKTLFEKIGNDEITLILNLPLHCWYLDTSSGGALSYTCLKPNGIQSPFNWDKRKYFCHLGAGVLQPEWSSDDRFSPLMLNYDHSSKEIPVHVSVNFECSLRRTLFVTILVYFFCILHLKQAKKYCSISVQSDL